MPEKESPLYTSDGHQDVLESILENHKFDLVESFMVRFTFCAVAKKADSAKVFISIKGYKNNEGNEATYQRAVISNRLAQEIKHKVMPEVIGFNTFEQDNVLWMSTVSEFEGEPISREEFFTGSEDVIDDKMISSLRQSLEVIEQSPSGEFYNPKKVSKIIKATFGHRVISDAPEWTSGHCDLHWGNVLSNGTLIDWETFSKAPKGVDAASLVLFSVSNPALFEKLYQEFAEILHSDSGKVATLLEAARIYYRISSGWKRHEPKIREAVMRIVNPRKIRWPKSSDV